MYQANGTNPYQSSAVETASPQALVTMLYDRILTALIRAQEATGDRALETIHNELTRAQQILTELLTTLDHERGGQIAANLAGLYSWCHREIVQANVSKDTSELEEVQYVIEDLRDAWEEATAGATVGSG